MPRSSDRVDVALSHGMNARKDNDAGVEARRPDATGHSGLCCCSWFAGGREAGVIHYGVALLNFAADFRKHCTSVYANQAHHPGDDDEDDCQHDGVFSDILSFGIPPQPIQIAVHDCPLDSNTSQPPEIFGADPEHGT
jgi:hypothetical protein